MKDRIEEFRNVAMMMLIYSMSNRFQRSDIEGYQYDSRDQVFKTCPRWILVDVLIQKSIENGHITDIKQPRTPSIHFILQVKIQIGCNDTKLQVSCEVGSIAYRSYDQKDT